MVSIEDIPADQNGRSQPGQPAQSCWPMIVFSGKYLERNMMRSNDPSTFKQERNSGTLPLSLD